MERGKVGHLPTKRSVSCILMTGAGGGGRGGLGIRGGAAAPRPLPLACLDFSVAAPIAGLRMIVDACVDIDRAGDDSLVPDSGEEERCSRRKDETVDEARSFEGTREALGRSCTTRHIVSSMVQGRVRVLTLFEGSGSGLMRAAGDAVCLVSITAPR